MAQPEPENRLTFGVELEFVIGIVGRSRDRSRNRDPHNDDPRPVRGPQFRDFATTTHDIATKLRDANIPAYAELYFEDPLPPNFRECWVVKRDLSVIEEVVDGYHYEGIEIASPPYFYDSSAISAVEQVLATLRKSYRLRINKTTGLHVHVGNALNGLQPKKLRNLLAMALTYEPLVYLMVDEDRVAGRYSRPISSTWLARTSTDRADFLERILALEDMTPLTQQGSPEAISERIGFNILGLTRANATNKQRTIEFRHHQGSLDPEAIKNWMHFCIKLVEKACLIQDDDEEEEQKFIEKMRHDIRSPIGYGEGKTSLVKFLTWLGCPVQAYYYEKRLLEIGDARVEQRLKEIDATFALAGVPFIPKT